MPALMIVFSATALLLMGLSLPLVLRRVKPNYLYGLRVPATFADEFVWYEANARSGRDLFALGLVELIFALVPVIDPTMPLIVYALGNAIFLGAGVVGMAIIGWLRANRLLKERRANTG
jgi:uncharacterized membrane protein